jgi:hypothetical protein
MADEKPQVHPLTAILTPTVATMSLIVSLTLGGVLLFGYVAFAGRAGYLSRDVEGL